VDTGDSSMPVGTGINHQAVVTLYEIYPLKGENEQEMIAFLKLQSQKIDVEFISYTAESGSWKFRVKHF
jgi:hypothetical protein